MSELLSFVLSQTKRRPIKSIYLTDPLILAPFFQNDSLSGRIVCVQETGDVTNPTTPILVDGSNGIVLRDGATIYASAEIAYVQNTNELVFTMSIASVALSAALAEVDFINAQFEVRISSGGQDVVMCQEAVAIRASTSEAVPIGMPLGNELYIPGITRLSGGLATDLDSLNLTALGDLSLVKVVIPSRGESHWQKVTDLTSPATDLDAGIVVPVNYDSTLRPFVLRRTSGF